MAGLSPSRTFKEETMNHTTFLRTSDGTLAQSGEALDERGLLRDGFVLQRTVSMMDTGRTPVFSDEERARKFADIEARKTLLSNAWRDPTPPPQQRPGLAAELAALERRPNTPPTRDALEIIRAERDRRLADAWRH